MFHCNGGNFTCKVCSVDSEQARYTVVYLPVHVGLDMTYRAW